MTRNPLMTVLATGFLLATPLLARTEDLGTKLTDEQITEHVKQKLALADPIIAQRIQVTTHDGVVTLAGMALTQQYILNALHDAGTVEGVVKVENRLNPST
ncbi:MAG TPA: BON domain-containing protein [Steroidobacteraceae bacterium]|jgi:osmotically-inducible protein OsmY